MTKGAKLLKIYRVTNDLTQQDFSQKYNVNRSTIASIESDNTFKYPSPNTFGIRSFSFFARIFEIENNKTNKIQIFK